ncbi:MAG: hypothetical protein NUW08_03225 [Candidatus Uhrbacteria bacterium]|nr:hypothetical protein [Candidatus Uhrbacteria bacterium]
MTHTVLLVIGLYLVLGLFETRFPAQRGQTIEGRLRNVASRKKLRACNESELGVP